MLVAQKVESPEKNLQEIFEEIENQSQQCTEIEKNVEVSSEMM